MKIRVPGNLLLLGEYAITMPGGLGVAFAVERYVTIEMEEASKQEITSKDNAFIEFILDELQSTTPLQIHVDSSELFTPEGQKRGLGSSAAIIVGLTYGYLKITQNDEPDLLKDVFPRALKIHRAYQGGRGSGYDVMTSLFGGVGLFTGGEKPSWKPLDPPWKNSLSLFQGQTPVSTKDALCRFELLEQKERYLKLSNMVVSHFVLNHSLSTIDHAHHLHSWIHQEMDMPVEKLPVTGHVKPLGAGGEIAAVFNHPKLKKITIAQKGVQCL